jgi:ketosteroid isomerase-like protein
VSDSKGPRPSPEIEAVLRRLAAAFRDQDVEAMDNLYSRSSLFRNVGSDANEVWNDPADFRGVMRAQLGEMGSFDFEIESVEGFESGDVGWGLTFGTYTTPDGVSVPMRMSSVLVLEGGVWRCVLSHNSIPVANEDALGVTLTTTLAALLDSLDEEALAPIDGRVGTSALMFTDIEGSTSLGA